MLTEKQIIYLNAHRKAFLENSMIPMIEKRIIFCKECIQRNEAKEYNTEHFESELYFLNQEIEKYEKELNTL